MTHFKLILKYAFLDLKKQKIRTLLAIIGLLISVGLLTVILFLNDSISSSYVDYLTIEAGNQDAVITVRHFTGEPEDRSSYFEFDPIINTIKNVSTRIKNCIPRMDIFGTVNVSEGFNTTELTGEEDWSVISAVNFSFENDIKFGSFINPNNNDFLNLEELPLNHCAIYYGFNNIIRYAVNDTIEIKMQLNHGNVNYTVTKNLTIDAIFDFNLKWSNEYRNRHLIVVDINTIYQYFGYEEFNRRCSQLILTFKEGSSIYDIRDLEGTKSIVKDIASEIQVAIGIKEFNIDLPKLRVLGRAEFVSVLIVIVFIFVSIVAMLISGVLINGILKTSVEEKIREYGIFRTLGANKKYSLAIVLMQGFLLCNLGSISGIVVADLISRFVIIPFANTVVSTSTIGFTRISFSFSLSSILISYAMGIGVGMIVSISPALKAMRLQLIESIHPYRQEDTLYRLQKRSSINYKIILVGIILAINGGFVFYFIPRLLISNDSTLFAGVLIAVLLLFNIGLTLAGLGLIPIVLRFVIQVFRPLAGRLHNVIKIFVFRYQRRNSSTVMIFALSFSFVIFTSTLINTLSAQSAANTQLTYGSDLVIETSGWEEPGESYTGGLGGGPFFPLSINDGDLRTNDLQIQQISINIDKVMTIEFEEQLLSIDGIEKVSCVIAKPYQLTQIYSETDKEFSAEIEDYTASQEITLIGIDEEYLYTVKRQYIEMTSGSVESAFNNLFNDEDEYTCIISEAISIGLNLRIRDSIRIVIHRGDELEVYLFTIVGIARSIPGFPFEFGVSNMQAIMSGVLISQNTYLQVLDIPPIPYVDRIFIKLREDGIVSPYYIEEIINELYITDYNYNLYNLERLITQQQSAFFIIDTLFTLIAMTTVFICIFGLLSSSYSTIIERKKEVGIIRTLGLKGREINRLFIIESLIIMLSSGTIGIIVGWLSAWIVTSNLSVLTGEPNVIYVPWFNIILIYFISIFMILIGMKLLLRKIRKKKIVDIYRETM